MGLIGPNGAGKTTILKMITGEKKPDTGFIQLGNNVKMGYYSQEQERLHPKLTVLDEVRDTFNFGEKKPVTFWACSSSGEMTYSRR